LYDFWGITYSTGQGVGRDESPEPSSAYEQGEGGGGFLFIYPTENFRVLQGQTPFDVTNVPNVDWTYVSTVAVVKSSMLVYNLPEKFLNYVKIKSYLYNESGEPVSSSDFSEIYRWVKESNGYTFNYNAFFTVEQEDSQIFVKTSLILINPNNYDALQKTKI